MKLFQAFLVVTTFLLFNVPFSNSIQQKENVGPQRIATHVRHPAPLPVISTDSLAHQLEKAVWNNDTKTLKTLIERGVDLNQINEEDGYAALHWAVERNLMLTIRVLLDNGARINIFTQNAIGNDRTPLHIASELGHAEIVGLLLAHDANANARTVHGETPLHGVRLFVKDINVVRALIEHQADVNAQTKFGTTPLHAASLLGSAQVTRLLIEHGAAADQPNKRGLTPLHHAAQQGHVEVVKALLKAKVSIDAQTRGGDTAMHLAVKKGHTEVIRLLLSEGANPLTLNNFSKSPLSEAQARANNQVIELFSAAVPTPDDS